MQTDKKNALSWDNPEYITKPKVLLLQKNGNQFFQSYNKAIHQLPKQRSSKYIITNLKYGLSKDSPFHSKYTEMHKLTPAIFMDEPNVRSKNMTNLWKTTNQSPPSHMYQQAQPIRYRLFSKLLNRSASREECLKVSLMEQQSQKNLNQVSQHHLLNKNTYSLNTKSYEFIPRADLSRQ
jgi:hypothetical protein